MAEENLRQISQALGEAEEAEDKEKHLLEVVCDGDYARNSTSSFQILLD